MGNQAGTEAQTLLQEVGRYEGMRGMRESVTGEDKSEISFEQNPQKSENKESYSVVPMASGLPTSQTLKADQIKKSALRNMRSFTDQLASANKELWLILSMLILAAAMNYMITAQRMILGFYTLPTIFSAYFYGRRHATLTAFASVFLVGLMVHFKPDLFNEHRTLNFLNLEDFWYDIVSWGGILILTAYALGTLNEKNRIKVNELRQTYYGLLHILRHFVSKDKYTENHSYRVSVYATKIAACLGFNYDQIEDVRGAALLHDIGKLDISRELLYKAARLTQEEYNEMKKHVEKGVHALEPVEGPLSRIIPIILAHHDKFDGTGYYPKEGNSIPLEARIISVADVYDSLTSDRPYRKAMSPFEAREIITKGAGTEFDPKIVDAFMEVFRKGEMEVPEVFL